MNKKEYQICRLPDLLGYLLPSTVYEKVTYRSLGTSEYPIDISRSFKSTSLDRKNSEME
jgi:hypothetical protein